jgi:hypothetical protein
MPVLLDAMHCESSRTLQPFLFAGTLIELQKQDSVSSNAMAKVRSLSKRTRSQREVSCNCTVPKLILNTVFRAVRGHFL